MRIAGRFGAIGIEMGLSVVVGFCGGRWLDAWLDTGPWLSFVGLGFGLAAGFKSLYFLALRARAGLEAEPVTER